MATWIATLRVSDDNYQTPSCTVSPIIKTTYLVKYDIITRIDEASTVISKGRFFMPTCGMGMCSNVT